MPGERSSDNVAPLHPASLRLAEVLASESAGQAIVVIGEQHRWMAIEEGSSGIAFAEAEGNELRVVPFIGNADALRGCAYYVCDRASWLEGAQELVLRVDLIEDLSGEHQVQALLKAALAYWVQASTPRQYEPPLSVVPSPAEPASQPADFADFDDSSEVNEPGLQELNSGARLQADISSQWSWASASARIPQIFGLRIDTVEPISEARISVSVADADLKFGSTVAYEGPLAAGVTVKDSVHVPLSAALMSQIEERRGATCLILLEDLANGRVLAQLDEAIDLQPHNLWLWRGDPRRSEQTTKLLRRYTELVALLQSEPERDDAAELHAELQALGTLLQRTTAGVEHLSRSLLAAFVRPNDPEVAQVAREAAELLGKATGDSRFYAFQESDVHKAEVRADATVDALYEALLRRAIAYSEPPPGWDYRLEGQRIREHGVVARGGLGTCMDTTVLLAALIEHAGLLPVLVMLPGHIFVGYWRRDPLPPTGGTPDWYPAKPFIADIPTIDTLVNGGWIGIIETTTLATGSSLPASGARRQAVATLADLDRAEAQGYFSIIDVVSARQAGVSPLPAVSVRADGVIEVVEYRAGAAPNVTEVAPASAHDSINRRRADSHPARYRTWKSTLFSLGADNKLLNLSSGPRVQPLVLPGDALGRLEDMLNQDATLNLHSGYDIPELWRARGLQNAAQILESGTAESTQDLLDQLSARRLFIQRFGTVKGQHRALAPSTFASELRSMAHNAKVARDERGMNPLFLCLGMLRWPYKAGAFAEAPLILVPVNITVTRGRQDFALSLDTSQQTTPNAALLEWLRHEHNLSIPGLAEPLTDRAGIDVDAVLADVRAAIAEHGLAFDIANKACLATLDLSAFRMWQDLNLHAETFLSRPLVKHLVETPTEQYIDTAIPEEQLSAEVLSDVLEEIDTPIPADSTQRRAVLWAREGRTFVLQGPPGTGKSQTITNMVAECLLSGQRVLFVAEKGTALSVVQRRLESIGLAPFTLNLHEDSASADQVRAQLKRALTASVTPDSIAMESARRRLRNARFELQQYPQHLHAANAAKLSAYTAHDELLVLGNGSRVELPQHLVAHEGAKIEDLRELFRDLQRWTAAAGVRQHHPWRFAGPGDGDPFDVQLVSQCIRDVVAGADWAASTTGSLHDALAKVQHPSELRLLAAAANNLLPTGQELTDVLRSEWPDRASAALQQCSAAAETATQQLRGFSPACIDSDLGAVLTAFRTASQSGLIGRGKRQTAALAPLSAFAPAGFEVVASNAELVLHTLISSQEAAREIRDTLNGVPGLAATVPRNPLIAGALSAAHHRLTELVQLTAPLRHASGSTSEVAQLAATGVLRDAAPALVRYADAWLRLCDALAVSDDDLSTWVSGRSLGESVQSVRAVWLQQAEYERLLPLQNWCTLIRKVEPLRQAGLLDVRAQLLAGELPAHAAEDALIRGVAYASRAERITASGLDRFNVAEHEQRVESYSQAQADVRKQWVTHAPASLLERRGGGGMGSRTGGLARELEKTTRKLGTRAILRKYGEAVQELVPLVLCSPSSAVDLIEPGAMEFDLVIFDEASQITVPEAVGSLGRARAAIIVGDTKQMPPTRKISASSGGSDEYQDLDVEELVEDQESILSECELARVPTLSLNWHYRSQDEALIAFSNRQYYGGELSSFPTPSLLSQETGLEFRRIHWPEQNDLGMYIRAGSSLRVDFGNGIVAGSNTNPFEAQAIVEWVHELVRETSALPSLGIVTFNEQQRELIEALLQSSPDPRVADVMNPAKMGAGDVLFVKALEQVQGDERDVIVFSIAFSKQANGKIPTNFGPLTNSGGERRLNVAVTRARRKNVVFCSFDPSELDVAGSSYSGPKHLKAFLTFAKDSGSFKESGETKQRMTIRDRHRDDIVAAFRDAGLHVMSDVGLSNFRLDLVLGQADRPDRPLLPVLLDGESWRKRYTVSDRDVLPVEVLKNLMGWPIVARIWWPMWLQNRADVIAATLALVDRAEELMDARGSESTPEVESTVAAEPTPAASQPAASLPSLAPDAVIAEAAPAEVETKEVQPADERESTSIASRPAAAPAEPHSVQVGATRVTPFVEASTEQIGARDTLDKLSERACAAEVKRQALDVIEAEGPIELGRLARIVGRRFGLSTVRQARIDEIVKLVPRSQVRRSRKLGDFAWPTNIEPTEWRLFRSSPGTQARLLDEVAPEEIMNAMRHVREISHGALDPEDVLRQTAELFGFIKLGPKIRSRLQTVYDTLLISSEAVSASHAAPARQMPAASPQEPTVKEQSPSALPEEAPARSIGMPPTETPAAPEARPVDPFIVRIVERVTGYVPDFSRVDPIDYYDFQADAPLRPELKRLVDQIVLDPTYDGSQGHKGVGARAAHLTIDDAHAVGNSAASVWWSTVGNAFSTAAEQIASHLIADPEFDPLPWDEDLNGFVASRMGALSPRLLPLVQRQLIYFAHSSGLIAKVEAELHRQARRVMQEMSALEMDTYGFTSRNAKKLQLIEPYLAGVKANRHRYIVYWISRFETDELALKREARYATAARRLAKQGLNRSTVSRTLGISTGIMDRIERENRTDVVLSVDDPIVVQLAPSLGQGT